VPDLASAENAPSLVATSPASPAEREAEASQASAIRNTTALALQAKHVPYKFESQATSRRTVEALRELPLVKTNLAIAAGDPRFDVPLTSFIIAHHLNIEWYDKRIEREERARKIFVVCSMLLLVLIPVCALWLPGHVGEASATTLGTLGFQLTALLTGLIAVQNALRGELDKRNLVAIFHKASASLKKAVFEFECRWAGKTPAYGAGGTDVSRFCGSIDDATRLARDTEDEEEDEYFAAIASIPLPDVGATLLSAGQTAGTIVNRVSKTLPSASDNAEALRLRTNADSLTALLLRLQAQETQEADPAARAALQAHIQSTRSELQAVQSDLLAAVAKQFDHMA
jgi:hypothetical protein